MDLVTELKNETTENIATQSYVCGGCRRFIGFENAVKCYDSIVQSMTGMRYKERCPDCDIVLKEVF